MEKTMKTMAMAAVMLTGVTVVASGCGGPNQAPYDPSKTGVIIDVPSNGALFDPPYVQGERRIEEMPNGCDVMESDHGGFLCPIAPNQFLSVPPGPYNVLLDRDYAQIEVVANQVTHVAASRVHVPLPIPSQAQLATTPSVRLLLQGDGDHSYFLDQIQTWGSFDLAMLPGEYRIEDGHSDTLGTFEVTSSMVDLRFGAVQILNADWHYTTGAFDIYAADGQALLVPDVLWGMVTFLPSGHYVVRATGSATTLIPDLSIDDGLVSVIQ